MLFQQLSKKLEYPFRRKDEQRFLYMRLLYLDQLHCLEVDQESWQSYLDIGLQQQRWPVSFCLRKSLLVGNSTSFTK